ncbi:MAG: hypothetical protein HC875_09220 [Anaerolineales bacterium]|nr:hypothetical protein [Anaerolineales bacterium]
MLEQIQPALAAYTGTKSGRARPGDILQLQRAYGNRAISRLLNTQAETVPPGESGVQSQSTSSLRLPQVSRTRSGPIQRFMSPTNFKDISNRGLFGMRDETLEAIDAELEEYVNHKDPKLPILGPSDNGSEYTSLKQTQAALAIIEEIEYLTINWLKDYEGDEGAASIYDKMKKSFYDLLLKRAKTIITNRQKALQGSEGLPAVTRDPNQKFTKIKEQYEGTIDSSLTKVAPLIDLAVPTDGTSGEVETELKIPIPPAYVGGRLKVEAERDEGYVKLKTELVITGGADIGIAELGGELGGYLEAKAKTTSDAMRLISYGLYRRVRESKANVREVASKIWGGSTSETIGYKRAERLAANVEENIFARDEEAYVQTGALAKARGEAGINLNKEKKVGLEGELAFQAGRNFNKKSVEHFKKKFLTKEGQFGAGPFNQGKQSALGQIYMPKHRGGMETFGANVNSLKLAFKADAGPLVGEAEGLCSWEENLQTEKTEFRELELKVKSEYKVDVREGALAKTIIDFIVAAIQATRTAIEKYQGTISGGQAAVGIAQALASAGQGVAGSADMLKPYTHEWGKDMDDKVGFEPNVGGGIVVGITKTANTPGVKISVELRKVTELGGNAGIVKGKIKKNERLIGLMFEAGTWKPKVT